MANTRMSGDGAVSSRLDSPSRPGRPVLHHAVALGIGLAVMAPAHAFSQTTPPAPAAPAADTKAEGWLERDKLLGDMGGLRTALAAYGVTIGLTDIEEVMGNVSGGLQRGATYDALTTLTIQLDTSKAFGWDGGTFNLSAMNIRGRSLSVYNIGNLQNVSGISAVPTTRLWEIWYQQNFLGDKASIRVGQQSLDQEFLVSTNALLFMNTVFGWPMLPGANLYAGGPAYPLSSLGVRLKYQPTDEITVLGGVFQDNPPGGPFANDGQLRGSTRWGGNFNLRTGALVIGEIQYAVNPPPEGKKTSSGLSGTYKLGFWYDSAAFPNQRYAQGGMSLADPAGNGVPMTNRNNFGLYGVIDQMVWRPDAESPQSLNAFLRIMGGPGDRNLLSFHLNVGLTLKAPFDGRDDDTFGVAFGLSKYSAGATGLDRDIGFYNNVPYPVRTNESFIEVTYQAAVTPWMMLQPDFQYIMRPGGGVVNPQIPGQALKNAAVLGLRSTITF